MGLFFYILTTNNKEKKMVKVIDEKTNIYRFTLQRKQYYDLYIEADNKKEAKDEM